MFALSCLFAEKPDVFDSDFNETEDESSDDDAEESSVSTSELPE